MILIERGPDESLIFPFFAFEVVCNLFVFSLLTENEKVEHHTMKSPATAL